MKTTTKTTTKESKTNQTTKKPDSKIMFEKQTAAREVKFNALKEFSFLLWNQFDAIIRSGQIASIFFLN